MLKTHTEDFQIWNADLLQRHVLVKGCGKAESSNGDVKQESSSDVKTENLDSKPNNAVHA